MSCRRPCVECPWVRETPPGQFPASRYVLLASTTGTAEEQVMFHEPWFACHLAPVGEEFYCAGWMAAVGFWHIGVRMALAEGRVPRDAVRHVREPVEDGWPALHASYAELLSVHGPE